MGSKARRIAPAVAAALLAAAAGAQACEFVVSGPDFTIVVKGLQTFTAGDFIL